MSYRVSQGEPAADDGLIRAEIEEFYTQQMHIIDCGRVDEWAETFAEDSIFTTNAHDRPTVGRAAIREAVQAGTAELIEAKVVRRHWTGMLTVTPSDDGSVRTRFYALVLHTQDGRTVTHGSAVVEDELGRCGGTWSVRRRNVIRDDI